MPEEICLRLLAEIHISGSERDKTSAIHEINTYFGQRNYQCSVQAFQIGSVWRLEASLQKSDCIPSKKQLSRTQETLGEMLRRRLHYTTKPIVNLKITNHRPVLQSHATEQGLASAKLAESASRKDEAGLSSGDNIPP